MFSTTGSSLAGLFMCGASGAIRVVVLRSVTSDPVQRGRGEQQHWRTVQQTPGLVWRDGDAFGGGVRVRGRGEWPARGGVQRGAECGKSLTDEQWHGGDESCDCCTEVCKPCSHAPADKAASICWHVICALEPASPACTRLLANNMCLQSCKHPSLPRTQSVHPEWFHTHRRRVLIFGSDKKEMRRLCRPALAKSIPDGRGRLGSCTVQLMWVVPRDAGGCGYGGAGGWTEGL
eukprot:1157434-Pelagomonas_calceolata.AAC.1